MRDDGLTKIFMTRPTNWNDIDFMFFGVAFVVMVFGGLIATTKTSESFYPWEFSAPNRTTDSITSPHFLGAVRPFPFLSVGVSSWLGHIPFPSFVLVLAVACVVLLVVFPFVLQIVLTPFTGTFPVFFRVPASIFLVLSVVTIAAFGALVVFFASILPEVSHWLRKFAYTAYLNLRHSAPIKAEEGCSPSCSFCFMISSWIACRLATLAATFSSVSVYPLYMAHPLKEIHNGSKGNDHLQSKVGQAARYFTRPNHSQKCVGIFDFLSGKLGEDFDNFINNGIGFRIKHGGTPFGIIRRVLIQYAQPSVVVISRRWVRAGKVLAHLVGSIHLLLTGSFLSHLLSFGRVLQIKIKGAQHLTIQRAAIDLRAFYESVMDRFFFIRETNRYSCYHGVIVSPLFHRVKYQFLGAM